MNQPTLERVARAITGAFYDRHADATPIGRMATRDEYIEQCWKQSVPEAMAAIEGVGNVNDWQVISKAPRDGTVVDLWHKHGFRIHDTWWEDGLWMGGFKDSEVTHFRHLPEPPPGAGDMRRRGPVPQEALDWAGAEIAKLEAMTDAEREAIRNAARPLRDVLKEMRDESAGRYQAE